MKDKKTADDVVKDYWSGIRESLYTLRLHNDNETVIGRIKNALCNITFPFYECEFKSVPYPKDVDRTSREWISRTIHAIWDGKGNYTAGYENETDDFLDEIGLPMRERAGLIRHRLDCEGLVCAECGKIGKTVIGKKRVLLSSEDKFAIYPDGKTVCLRCERMREFEHD